MSAADDLNYIDYVKEAFSRRSDVALLGGIPLNYLGLAAFGVLGLANPGFWLLGAALELGYLAWMAGSERFRRVVQGERLLVEQQQHDTQVQTTLDRLAKEGQHRYRALHTQCVQILGISESLGDVGLSLNKMRTGGLNQLLAIFLRLLTSREVLMATMSQTDRARVERELEELEKKLSVATADTSLERSLRGSFDIQRKRVENLDRAATNLEVLDAELGRIEQRVALIREETAVSGRADELSDRLDVVSGTLDETNRWMEQNAEIFGSVDATVAPDTSLPVLRPPPVPATESAEES